MKNTLMKIISQPQSHAKWINTLAYLEHIGSRKIMKSLNSRLLNLDMLEHLTEETRHAYFLKKIVEKNFPGYCPNFSPEHLLGNNSPDVYFQSLDKYVNQHLPEGKSHLILNYYYVTLLIEKRALQVYESYQNLLQENGFSFKLTPLILEEQKHLKETENAIAILDSSFAQNLDLFLAFEHELYLQFISDIDHELSLLSAPEATYG